MEHVSLSAELGEIRYAIEGAHWIADSVAMGAVPDPERTHSAPVIISAILLLVETRLHQLGRVLRGEENPGHLLTPHNATTQEEADKDDVVLRAWVQVTSVRAPSRGSPRSSRLATLRRTRGA